MHPDVDVLITLDIETFFSDEYSLQKKGVTTESYVRDPRFELHGVGVKVADAPAFWLEREEFIAWSKRVPWHRVAMLCHNTAFDGFALSHHYGIVAGMYLDTLSIGRALLGGEVGKSLDSMTKHFDCGTKGKELELARGKHREDFTPENWALFTNYCENDVDITHALFWKVVESIPELEHDAIDLTLRCFIDPILELDRETAEAERRNEAEKKATLLTRITADKSVLQSNEQFAALLTEMDVDVPMKLSVKQTQTAREKNPDAEEIWVPAFAKNDDGFKALLEHPREEIRFLAEARAGVKSTIRETRAQSLLNIHSRGKLPVFLKYYGAWRTGRWSAGDSSNFQNLPRVDKKNPKSGLLRKALVAPKGHVILACDSGQIEARKNAWASGHTTLLEIFRRNDAQTDLWKSTGEGEEGDFYSDAGSPYFGKKLSKEHTPDERQVAKGMLLGLGFQMGAARFSAELLKGLLGLPPIQFTMLDAAKYGVDVADFASEPYNIKWVKKIQTRISFDALLVHCAVAKYFVNLYREMNPPIVKFWETCSEAIEAMYLGERMRFGPGECFETTKNGIHLPSGGMLRYPGLRRSEKGDFSYRGGRGKGDKAYVKIYGGQLCENIVQRSARDVVAFQAVRLVSDGVRIVTLTHDEIVAVDEAPKAEATMKHMREVMRIAPDWAAAVPLFAEGGFNRSYGLAK